MQVVNGYLKDQSYFIMEFDLEESYEDREWVVKGPHISSLVFVGFVGGGTSQPIIFISFLLCF